MQRNTFIGKGVVAGLLIAAMGLAAPAVVSAAQPPTEKVRISDLDLATAKGQQAFERRLQVALDRVCERPNDSLPQTSAVQQRVDACKAGARSGAMHQLQTHGVQLASAVRSE